jgi:hypothetical protein
MKAINIHFFSPNENSQVKPKTEKAAKPANVVLTGYISSAGKLVLPAKTVASIGVNLDTTFFKVGMDEGKRKAKSLYLVPASSDPNAFSFEKAAKSYTLALPFILTKSGIDFTQTKYDFTIHLFEYDGQTAFVLKLTSVAGAAKAPYTGKPRGRKPRQDPNAE